MAELPQIEELCEALLDTYGAVEEGSLAVSERFFAEAERAHEALIGMMDQVAAALQVTPQPERVQALRELLQEVVDPAALALLDPKLTSGLTVEELDDAPLADLIDWNATDTELPPLAELVEEPPVFDEVSLPELTGAGLEDDLSAPPAEPAPVVADVAAPSVYESLDEEMVAIFLEEAVDILESAGQSLDRWLGEPDNHTSLLSLQRDLHTLKGGARMAEIAPIGDLAHELESLYEGLVDRRFSYSPALGGLLQQSHDSLAVLLDQLQARLPLDDPQQLIQAIRTFRQNGGLSLSAAAAVLPPEDIEEVALVEEIDLAGDDAPAPEHRHRRRTAAPGADRRN